MVKIAVWIAVQLERADAWARSDEPTNTYARIAVAAGLGLIAVWCIILAVSAVVGMIR